MTTEDAETAVNYGAAHGALAMTTPGDTTMVSVNEVEAIMGGAGARVQRQDIVKSEEAEYGTEIYNNGRNNAQTDSAQL